MTNYKVYLIPDKEDTYRACIAIEPPAENAIFLVDEGTYPVEYFYRRNDLNGCSTYMMVECTTREELSEALNWNGKCRHRVVSLWDFDYNKTDNEPVLRLFYFAYVRLMEELDKAYQEILDDLGDEDYDEDYDRMDDDE